MNEERGRSQLEVRIANAQALSERGKQRRALDELWEAEAQARGDASAIDEMIDFTTSLEQRIESRQRSGLADLVAALEHDAETASLSRAAPLAPPSDREPASALRVVLVVIAAVLSAGGGLVVFVTWVLKTSCGLFSTTVGGYPEHIGGLIALAVVAGIGLWLTSIFLAGRHMDRLHYLFLPFVGFIVSYIVILVAIAEVAKAIWGPMQCRYSGLGF